MTDASGSGVVAGEIPVARVGRAGVVKALDALEHQFDR